MTFNGCVGRLLVVAYGRADEGESIASAIAR
jgi:hypothetical protein